ncbi:MAG: hypothetical protein JWQ66_3038 [Mucilaginibacter sp.]|nr:hypothetical protein [Mucilaginibacter sp.]
MNREEDILQIRKYLNGELDGRAMHELERRAIDDPFLVDALEGFEQADSDQQANLDELSGRLQQRIDDKKVKWIIPWWPISVAASILIVIGAGIWFFSGQQPEQPKQLAQNIKPEKKEQPVVSSPSPVAVVTPEKDISTTKVKQRQPKAYSKKNADTVNQLAAEGNADKKPATPEPIAAESSTQQEDGFYKPKKDSVAPNEMAVNAVRQKKQVSEFGKMKETAIAKPKPPVSAETLVQSRAEGVTVTPSGSKTVTGVVISSDGLPITGATVKIVGKPFGVVTDVNGKFALPDVSKNQTLAVNYIGYNSKKVKVDGEDSLNISLQPAGSSLNEVVVVRKDDNDAATEDAHPHDGWHAYDEYLKKNTQSPDGKTGKVKVSFMVAADGSLSQFKIIKSLSDAADKKAIALITNGPAWVGGTDGKAKEKKVSVSFK